MNEPYGLKEWRNVLKQQGRIDPATIALAEQRIKEIQLETHICYDENYDYNLLNQNGG